MAFSGRESMANRIRPIVVNEQDRHELERLQRSPSAPAGLTRRARAVLMMAQDVPGVEIAERTGYTVVQVSRLRRRFAEYGVVGLYLNPPTHAVVLSLDEKTQIQALSRTQPLLPLRPGLPARQTHDYRRNGLTSLDAALEIASGRVIGECASRHTGADFLRFMKRLARRYRGRELHVVLDNSSTHSTPAVHAWLAKHPNVEFHFTPKGASWLNMVEAWFGILTRKAVRRGSFDTVRALIRHIEAYIADWNSHPTPFVWTKDPAAIVKKAIGRGR